MTILYIAGAMYIRIIAILDIERAGASTREWRELLGRYHVRCLLLARQPFFQCDLGNRPAWLESP